MKNNIVKYYLITYFKQSSGGGYFECPVGSSVFEFDEDKDPKQCFEEALAKLNPPHETGYSVAITNMIKID